MTGLLGRARPRVLMYHGVGHVARERDPHGMFVTAAAFRGQMEWLLEHDFQPLSEAGFLAALNGLAAPRKSVLITFDDGYLGVGEHAAPILRELGVPSIMFVPSRLLGGVTEWLATEHQHPLMTAEELRAVRSTGMAIGAHGLDHHDLSEMDAADLSRHRRMRAANLRRRSARRSERLPIPMVATALLLAPRSALRAMTPRSQCTTRAAGSPSPALMSMPRIPNERSASSSCRSIRPRGGRAPGRPPYAGSPSGPRQEPMSRPRILHVSQPVEAGVPTVIRDYVEVLAERTSMSPWPARPGARHGCGRSRHSLVDVGRRSAARSGVVGETRRLAASGPGLGARTSSTCTV